MTHCSTHGGPGSRLEAEIFHSEALSQGFRLISTDRPGMGQSDFMVGRTLLDYPKDISALANHLGLDRFGVIGWSGGGAHTTVCGYAIPDRITCNITLAGYTNFAEFPEAPQMLKSRLDRLAVKLAQKRSSLFGFFFWLLALNIKYFPLRRGKKSSI